MPATRLMSSRGLRASRGKASLTRTKDVGGKTREVLQYAKAARTASKANITKALNRGAFRSELTGEVSPQDAALAEGVYNMASVRLGNILSEEELLKIKNMDAERLGVLYKNDKFVFNVYFQYSGVNMSGGAYEAAEGKAEDVRFLIDQYERAFGTIPI